MTTRISSGEHRELSPITRSDIDAYFHAAARPPSAWRLGAEFEKLALYRDSGLQVPYEGPDGIRHIITQLAERFGWTPHYDHGHIIALLRDGASITLEPGGQLELSSSVCDDLHGLSAEVNRHLEELRALVDPERVAWVAIGMTPYSHIEDISIVPKGRYLIMDQYLPPLSPMARYMMRGTTSVQAAFDFSSEADAVRKFVASISFSPVVNCIFGNAPLYGGQPTGDVSFRGRIWKGMDPARSGLLPRVVRQGEFSFQRWIDYLLDAPMMFYCIDEVFTSAKGRTFRDYMATGYDGHLPTMEDWELHLTSIFPEVRLKKYLEVRGADCVALPLAMAIPAIWKGIFYDQVALDGALELAKEIPAEARDELFQTSFQRGLRGTYRGRTLVQWGRDVLALAAEGLKRQAQSGGFEDESRYLESALEVLDRGTSPGALLLEHWPSLASSPPALVRAIEY